MDVLGWTESWFVPLAGQTFICLVLGLFVASRLSRSPARAHAMVVLALGAALCVPFVSWFVKESNGGVFLASPEATAFTLPEETTPGGSPAWSVPVVLWGLVSFALMLGIAISYLRGRRLVARAEPVSEPRLLAALDAARATVGLRTLPELRSHAEVPSPMVWAWNSNPVALIPDEATCRVDGIDWESIFIHELAHVRRRDHLTGLFADIVAALLFWNPPVWWARRRLSRECEFACDDLVAVSGKSTLEFAGALLALRREALLPRIPATSLTGSRSWLKARVARLLQVSDRPPASFGLAWISGAVGVTCTVVIALALAQTRQGPRPEHSFAAPLPRVFDRTLAHAP